MTIYAIVKQIAEQLKGRLSIHEGKGHSNLYPFSVSVDRHENPVKIFTDPRDKKEYILDYKTEKDRLSQLKKLNKIISSYNDEAIRNNKDYLKMIPPDGKVHSATEVGFDKPLNTISEIPLWGFCVLGKTKKDKIFIDDKKLYELRIKLKNDYQFIAHLNRLLFKYIQIKRVESEKMGTWDSKNIWYKPNQRFHKWFQINNVSVEDGVQKGGRKKGRTKRTINRYKKVFKRFELLKKKFPSKTKVELYEILSLRVYDSQTYSIAMIRNILEQKFYNKKPSR